MSWEHEKVMEHPGESWTSPASGAIRADDAVAPGVPPADRTPFAAASLFPVP